MVIRSAEQRAQARQALAQRCVWARKRLKISHEEVGRRAGIAGSVIGNTERGRNETIRNIIPVARALQVNPNWLATGEGDPDDLPAQDGAASPFAGIPPDEIDMAITWLSIWRDADPISRDFIEGAFKVTADRQKAAPMLRTA